MTEIRSIKIEIHKINNTVIGKAEITDDAGGDFTFPLNLAAMNKIVEMLRSLVNN